MTTAVLRNKRLHPDYGTYYIVDLECPVCREVFPVAFGHWSAIGCLGCGEMLERPTKVATRFITSMGGPVVATCTQTGEQSNIGQYGVWDAKGRRKPEVIATGDDLEALQAEHGPDLLVYNITEMT
jgi:ribosomal protein S27E